MTSTGTAARMPAAFVGHGNPMNALQHNQYTETWRALGAAVPRPRAVLVISAHWYVGTTSVTAMRQPRTIHDFYGFPDELFAVDYPAPGDPAVADEIVSVADPIWVGLDRDAWGLDHGTWSVLVHMFPEADVPVLQLSLNALQPLEYHFALGAALAPLLDQGIMIVGSGNVVHNLSRIDWTQPATGFDWARHFNEAAVAVMTERPEDVLGLVERADFAAAAPTPDHFLPLVYVAGLAAATGEVATTLIDGYAMGSLSMASFGVATTAVVIEEIAPAAVLPARSVVPPDDTNS
jgi:4,5-DOPA dioxygenase extradiol